MAGYLVEVNLARAIRFGDQAPRLLFRKIMVDVHDPLDAKTFRRMTEDTEHPAMTRQNENSGAADDDTIFLGRNSLENLRLLLE